MKLYDSNGQMVELPDRSFGDHFGVGDRARAAADLGYSDPKAAAWGQALNNISAMNMGHAPTRSPVQAYQEQILARSTVSQQRKINDLTMQQQEQDLDSFYDFKTAKKDGIIPKDMSYVDFTAAQSPYSDKTTTNAQDMGTYRALVAEDKVNNTNNAEIFLDWKRASKFVDVGGGQTGRITAGSPGYNPVLPLGQVPTQVPTQLPTSQVPTGQVPTQVPTGQVPAQGPISLTSGTFDAQGNPVPNQEQGSLIGQPQGQGNPLAQPQVDPSQAYLTEFARREAELAEAKARGTATGTQLAAMSGAVRETAASFPQMQATIDRNNQLIGQIKAGALQGSGPLAGFVKSMYDPEFAALQAEGIYNTLLNLQITKLTPVSNEEVKLVSQMWASAFRGGKVNLSILEEANRRVQQLMDVGRSAVSYYESPTDSRGNPKQYGSMEGYAFDAPSPDETDDTDDLDLKDL